MEQQTPTIRSLRFQLASALADQAPGSGDPRASEALAQLDQALKEPGADPSEGKIHLAAGGFLEQRQDVSGALNRYMLAATGDSAHEALTRAHRLLATSPQPGSLIAALSRDATERVVELARVQPDSEAAAKLAARLLGQRGDTAMAADVLERSYAAARPASRELARHFSVALLDLGRMEEAARVVQETEPDRGEPSLQTVVAKVHLAGGDLRGAYRIADAVWRETDDADAGAVRALCLLGLGYQDDAFGALPESDTPDTQFARAILELQRANYRGAKEASAKLLRAEPNNPDVLLLNAQIAMEGLGSPREPVQSGTGAEASASAPDPSTPTAAGAELEAARQLLEEAAAELPVGGPRSYWWRAQAEARRDVTRYRYFTVELRRAAHLPLHADETDGIGGRNTQWIQDAALAEIKAEVLLAAGDKEGAAAARDEASEIFVNNVPDPPRACDDARAALTIAPSASRAAQFGYRASEMLVSDLEPAEVEMLLAEARSAAEHWLPLADDDDLLRLLHAYAWVLHGLNGLTPIPKSERLPWLLAGAAAGPDDGTLRAIAAWDMSSLGCRAGAMLMGEAALSRQPNDLYVVSAALATGLNYHPDRGRAKELLAHPTLSEEEMWRNAVELQFDLLLAEHERLATALQRPLPDLGWARRSVAHASVILNGLDAAHDVVEHALEISKDDTDDRPDRMILATACGRLESVTALAREAQNDPEVDDATRRECELIARFAGDPSMTADEFFTGALALCRSPSAVKSLVNVELPVLLAARSSDGRAPASVAVDEAAMEARMRELADPGSRWRAERPIAGGWWRLAELATADGTPAKLTAIIRDSPAVAEVQFPEAVTRLERRMIIRACADVPRRLFDSLRGRGPAVPPADVAVVLDARTAAGPADRLATALLADERERLGPAGAIADVSPDDLDLAIETVLGLIPPSPSSAEVRRTSVSDLWTLDAKLTDVASSEATDATLRDLAIEARERLGTRLDELLGLGSSDTEELLLLPLVCEVGDEVVPFVDNRVDGGHFIYELIPEMRGRILAETGVDAPGVRMRGDPSLPPNGFSVQIDEVSVVVGSLAFGAAAHVASDEDDAPPAQVENPPDALIAQMESAVRAHLDRLLGLDEVDRLVERWLLEDDDDLVASVVPGDDERLRLTWILQALVSDGLPILDRLMILTTIRDAGGVEQALPTLHRALRTRMLPQLPADRSGGTSVDVPAELEAALLGSAGPDAPAMLRRAPHHEFRRWLRDQIAEHGPALRLVAGSHEAREAVEVVARQESRLVTTVCLEELVAR